MYVDPAHRRHGVGRALLRAVADRAGQAGAVRVELSTDKTNEQAQALYESEGFVTGLPVRHYLRPISLR
ncbi:hypothetical protein Asi03nite_24830 [Actinoplanes siamensis]|uniref:N-acetyltransferase domain-containing protein n=1 Tax=Actinoplanes siamensis TaxID=1223317 RepID=A0A919TK84_9ACTN|nr:hypothetical protein Asi03nite_24830 [Actinoplanes siamensis]